MTVGPMGKVSGDREEEAVESVVIPPHAFAKGALVSVVVLLGVTGLLPLFATDPLATEINHKEVLMTASVFAGLPGLLIFGGLGRNLARTAHRGRTNNARRGVLLGAIAGVATALLAAIPTGSLPASLGLLLASLSAVALLGGASGALLGSWLAKGKAHSSEA